MEGVKHKTTAFYLRWLTKWARPPFASLGGASNVAYARYQRKTPLRTKAVMLEWARMDSNHRPYHPRRGHRMWTQWSKTPTADLADPWFRESCGQLKVGSRVDWRGKKQGGKIRDHIDIL